MRYTDYGSTGVAVSAVGFGGMRFDTELPLEANADLVRYANGQGITYFDTAPGYCQDQSEDIFGLAFRDMPRDFVVSTKSMPTSCDTAAKAREAVCKSLDRLGVDAIDFYHIWCLREMAHYELAMRPGGHYEGLLACREEGLIRHIVCSSHQPGPEIRAIAEDGKVAGILMGINVLNFAYRWEGVEAAAGRGLGVVAMNPLAGGQIPRHADRLGFLTAGDETPVEAALRFAIACPQITVTLVGCNNRAEIDAACRIADAAAPFAPADLERLRARLSAGMDALCTGCGYCTGCPQEIPIPGLMQVYNPKPMFGVDDAAMRKDLGGQFQWGMLVGARGKAGSCIACGLCEERCTQHLPIIGRLGELAAWEAGLEADEG